MFDCKIDCLHRSTQLVIQIIQKKIVRAVTKSGGKRLFDDWFCVTQPNKNL